jgi:hypothetical protein
MSPQELEAFRRGLFFSVAEAAFYLADGVSEQAWRRWETGKRTIPKDVEKRMFELSAWQNKTIAAIHQQMLVEKKDVYALIWYDSIDDWNSLPELPAPIFWRPYQSIVCRLYLADPVSIRLITFNSSVFYQWLNGRTHSEILRTAWAEEMLKLKIAVELNFSG